MYYNILETFEYINAQDDLTSEKTNELINRINPFTLKFCYPTKNRYTLKTVQRADEFCLGNFAKGLNLKVRNRDLTKPYSYELKEVYKKDSVYGKKGEHKKKTAYSKLCTLPEMIKLVSIGFKDGRCDRFKNSEELSDEIDQIATGYSYTERQLLTIDIDEKITANTLYNLINIMKINGLPMFDHITINPKTLHYQLGYMLKTPDKMWSYFRKDLEYFDENIDPLIKKYRKNLSNLSDDEIAELSKVEKRERYYIATYKFAFYKTLKECLSAILLGISHTMKENGLVNESDDEIIPDPNHSMYNVKNPFSSKYEAYIQKSFNNPYLKYSFLKNKFKNIIENNEIKIIKNGREYSVPFKADFQDKEKIDNFYVKKTFDEEIWTETKKDKTEYRQYYDITSKEWLDNVVKRHVPDLTSRNNIVKHAFSNYIWQYKNRCGDIDEEKARIIFDKIETYAAELTGKGHWDKDEQDSEFDSMSKWSLSHYKPLNKQKNISEEIENALRFMSKNKRLLEMIMLYPEFLEDTKTLKGKLFYSKYSHISVSTLKEWRRRILSGSFKNDIIKNMNRLGIYLFDYSFQSLLNSLNIKKKLVMTRHISLVELQNTFTLGRYRKSVILMIVNYFKCLDRMNGIDVKSEIIVEKDAYCYSGLVFNIFNKIITFIKDSVSDNPFIFCKITAESVQAKQFLSA